jgi:mannose-6-phosphate isomerase-like protein (cupin superfamily)
VRELPQYGPWPAEAHHLLHHHDNQAALHWLAITGTGQVEILAEAFEVDWPSVPSGAAS